MYFAKFRKILRNISFEISRNFAKFRIIYFNFVFRDIGKKTFVSTLIPTEMAGQR